MENEGIEVRKAAGKQDGESIRTIRAIVFVIEQKPPVPGVCVQESP